MRRVTIIGAGPVARSFAQGLTASGVQVTGIYSRTGRSAKRLARRIKAKYSGELNAGAVLEKIVLLAVPDDAVGDVAAALSSHKDITSGSVVLHTSGALTSDVLKGVKKRGASTGSIHPLQTFPGGKRTVLRTIWCAVEGDAAAVRSAMEIAKRTGMHPFRLAKKDKVLYHAAAVFASNYQVTVLSVVEHLASAARIPSRDVWKVFRPLITAATENVYATSPVQALTGPIARGDLETVKSHIAALAGRKGLEHLVSLYAALGVETAALAQRKKR